MTEFAQALIAMGILGTFSAAAGLITIKIAEHIVEETEKMEEEQEDYIYMNDGTPVLYNEEDQE
jgi:hypothetical protein